MCYIVEVTAEAAAEPETIGLRELRQHASDIVRRVEAGDTVTVTVSGRPAARIVPAGRRSWRRWEDIAGLFTVDRAAENWATERDLLDGAVDNPWPEH
jgi:prevent-host-death family protein